MSAGSEMPESDVGAGAAIRVFPGPFGQVADAEIVSLEVYPEWTAIRWLASSEGAASAAFDFSLTDNLGTLYEQISAHATGRRGETVFEPPIPIDCAEIAIAASSGDGLALRVALPR